MISNDYDLKLTINRSVLMDAVDRALLFVRENDKKPIIMEIEDNSLKLSIDTPQGSMKEEMETVKEGKDLVIGFNPRFILDALKAISDEQVTLYMLNAKAPCFIRDEDMSYTYLILPVNFNRN
jgi:DNA polymerase-3 subunit beta